MSMMILRRKMKCTEPSNPVLRKWEAVMEKKSLTSAFRAWSNVVECLGEMGGILLPYLAILRTFS